MNYEVARRQMVERQVRARGVTDEEVLEAMKAVPREEFVEERMKQFAYEDSPLPIEAGQTISQPFIVALMAEALDIDSSSRVLEVGAGSGYAAAVLGQIADEVYTVERHAELAGLASERMDRLGYGNVHVKHDDGTLGWPEHAPFDAILVSAGAPDVPKALREQLSIGGQLIVPVGEDPRLQELLRVVRVDEHSYEEDSLGGVRFVPLIGAQGWAADNGEERPQEPVQPLRRIREPDDVVGRIRQHAESFESIEDADLSGLLDRVGDARIVLLGEATHGTSEFYRMRARISQALIEEKGFDIVAIEGDWPDTAVLDRHVRNLESRPIREEPFSDFPRWMWRNREMQSFVEWLRTFNLDDRPDRKVSMHGLDLYSLNNSIGAVLDYLDRVDPEAAERARVRYSCFSPWETDPAVYGRAASAGQMEACETDAVEMLREMLSERLRYMEEDGDEYFDAERNAALIRNAEGYYRSMYYSRADSWNRRDRHMFETLEAVLDHRGPQSKAIVWAHNSHLGNAAATEMSVRGELNVGQLVKESYGNGAYAVGFGTHTGTVAAASNWNEPVQFMDVRPSHPDSYEQLFHRTQVPSLMLGLQALQGEKLYEELSKPRLERAIGVIYRPDTELMSHYFQAALPVQFDEYVWFDESSALEPLEAGRTSKGADTFPFTL